MTKPRGSDLSDNMTEISEMCACDGGTLGDNTVGCPTEFCMYVSEAWESGMSLLHPK